MIQKIKEINLVTLVFSLVALLVVGSCYFAYGLDKINNNEVVDPQMTKFISPLSIPVLVYHSVRPVYDSMTVEVKQFTVTPEVFENQLKYLLKKGYKTVSLEDVVLAGEGKVVLPPKPVVITFDDGWENQYEYAFPLLTKYGMTATFFVFTNSPGVSKYMTWDEIRELSDAGMTIGSHSKSHSYLDRIYDEKKLRAEIFESKSILESQIKRPVKTFAYPFGAYNESIAQMLKDAGYVVGRKFSGGDYKLQDDPFYMKGVPMINDLEYFKWLLD